MPQIISRKLNESFYQVKGSINSLKPIMKRLQVLRTDAYFDPMVKRGLKSPYDNFYEVVDNSLIIPAGLVQFLSSYGVNYEYLNPEFTKDKLDEYLNSLNLPFTPYKHQLNSFKDSILNHSQINLMCTGSGKSLTIALISDFLRLQGKKGLLVVPNINLLTQFQGDIKDYNLIDLLNNTHIIGGEHKNKNFDSPFTISTWQSLMNFKEDLNKIDYIIIDETHRAKGIQLQQIIKKCTNAKYKLGFTGTLNDNACDRMTLFGLFGKPKTYIKTQGLIDLGLATKVNINTIRLHYSEKDRSLFRHIGGYAKKLVFIKEHEQRNKLISKLSITLSKKGNTLVLFQHTNHGKDLFLEIVKNIHNVTLTNKDITGKHAFETQKKLGIYFINGEVKGKVREEVRNILENDSNSILVANFSILSTGVNIKNLHSLIFASPLKSFTTITQSIGRGVRKHISKDIFNVYDLVDMFTPKGIFAKQYNQRVKQSYETEGFPIIERTITLS